MKVAIVLNTSWNIYNFRMNFVRALIRQGYEVHTIAPNDEFTAYLTKAGCHHHAVKMDSRGINPIKDTALIIELWSIYRKIKPDIILHYTIKPNVYGSLAASFLGIPSINNVCGLGTVFLKDNLLSKVAKFLYRWTFRFPRKVFFQNPDDRNLFVDQKLVSADHTDLLPGSGIDLNHFVPAPFQRNRKFTFLLISRLITDKGILEYVDAVRKLRESGIDAKFQILGAKDPRHQRGIPLELIESWINTQTIEYLGTTKDVRPFIHAADCIVLPSYREGTPHTLLEAASCSKPIITTNVPGCHQVVEHQHNGLLCRVKDVDDLANTMQQMAAFDDNTLRLFGENGRRKMEAEFGEDLVIDKYIASIKEVEQAG